MERNDATGKWDPPFTSWPSSKAKRRKNCLPHSRTVSFSLFRPERHRHFLILRCLALIRCLFLFGHLIWQAIQSTFDISRPQHHRPVCNWPIRFCCRPGLVRPAIADRRDGYSYRFVLGCSVRIDRNRLQTIHLISDWISEANIKGESRKKKREIRRRRENSDR
jgi:hypothetical protein